MTINPATPTATKEHEMPSTNTATKDYLMGQPDAVLTCPTCHRLMVDGPLVLQHLLTVGTLTVADLPVRFVHLSHTVPAADGGQVAALECGTCNHERGQAEWTPPAGTKTARVGRLAAYRAAHEAGRAFRSRLERWG
jgi:hypothetical protein